MNVRVRGAAEDKIYFNTLACIDYQLLETLNWHDGGEKMLLFGPILSAGFKIFVV